MNRSIAVMGRQFLGIFYSLFNCLGGLLKTCAKLSQVRVQQSFSLSPFQPFARTRSIKVLFQPLGYSITKLVCRLQDFSGF
jgi:hypothetical protein